MKPIIAVLVALFVLLQYELWFAPGSVMTAYQMRESIVAQASMNKKQEERNSILAADIKDLKNGNEAIEERARNDLGMVKQGEIFYQMIKSPNSSLNRT